MGSYTRMASGNWRGQIMDGYTPEGKKNIVSFSAPTKSEAQRMVMEYLETKEAGKLLNRDMPTFKAWAEDWYADYRTQVQPSTYSGYQYTLRILTDHFGEKQLDEINVRQINAFVTELTVQGCSRSKISKCRAMLIQIFNSAVANELLDRNPARNSKIIKDLDMEPKEKEAFTDQEVETLKQELPDDLTGNGIRVLLGSGIRLQELLAFNPEDIAEDGSQVSVTKAIKMVDGQPVLGPPKSRQGRRIVPIPLEYRAAAMYLRTRGGKAFIWTSTRDNLLYSVGTFRRQYYKVLKDISGVRPLNPHCCRHTYVTRLQAKGVPMETIARLVGHATIDMTGHYLHISTDTLAQEVEKLSA